jgi:acyl transferase domain-containing protein/acyl carrier protein
MIAKAGTDDAADAVAIVGMAGRFPGATTVDEFWRNLQQGVESITFFTEDELLASGTHPAIVRHPAFVKAKGLLEGVELFDALFFGYTPKEAQLMDPQHRIFLECGWHALENAGYHADGFRGSIGVFAGAAYNQYMYHNVFRHPDGAHAIAYDKDFLSTRLSYKLNLNGPSMAVQTACSTSLVAVCQACQSLLSFQCDMALAGGIAINLPAKSGYFYQEGSILSPDGHCRAFDAHARGTVMGSGVGIVVLKRLADAIADGDRIRAVVKGFAVNNDGASKMGYTAPSIDGQAQVIAMAQALAGVDPDSIGYVEAHGTATELGDPIEVAALTQAFRASTRRNNFCGIGSVKSNIGHLDTAAGIAGLIKAVLALEHRQIPPTLHYASPNPKLELATSPFFVNTELTDWPRGPHPRRAGVSSFGIGGTNSHVVLEESPPPIQSSESPRWQVLTVSARTETGLAQTTTNLLAHLKSHPEQKLADVAYTLHVGRKKFPHGRVVVCRSHADAIAALEAPDSRRVLTAAHEPVDRPVVFAFPGQGVQHIDMARGLYETEPVFRRAVDECCDHWRLHLGFDLRQTLYPAPEQCDAASERIDQTSVTQPALFTIEYALARLWMSWGVRPAALIGHSIGEYVAACLSGVLQLDDALYLVAIRGQLMQQAPAGVMLALPIGEQRVRDLIGPGVWLSAVNGPSQCVVAGEESCILSLEARLRDEAVTYQRLRTAGAFHSGLMEAVSAPLENAVRSMNIGRPRIPYVSNVTGTWITEEDVRSPQYWSRHVCETVRFGAAVDTLLDWAGNAVFVEVGPGHTLGPLVDQQARRRTAQGGGALTIPSLRQARHNTTDGESLTAALGRLWLAGVPPDWPAYYAGEHRMRVELPAYPFERKRYWAEPTAAPVPARSTAQSSTTLVRGDVDSWFAIQSWKRSLVPSLLTERAPRPTRYLLFLDGSGTGESLADLLERRGHDVITVHQGNAFRLCAGRSFLMDPASPADYDALVASLRSSQQMPQLIVHLWGLSGSTDDRNDDGAVHRMQERGFYSLMYLAQALGSSGFAEAIRLAVVTDAVHDVTGEDYVCPEKATVLGACRVIPREMRGISCQNIDLAASSSFAPRIIQQIVGELESPTVDPVVAYRGIDRWVQTIEPVLLGGSEETPLRLREGGVYLITGGFGAIGLELARYLASALKPKLVLVGRASVPDRTLWQKHIVLHGRDDKMSRTIRALQGLEELGAELLVARADVGSEVQMRDVISSARRRFGSIEGVIHAAGVPGGGVIQLRDPAAAAAVMRPKVLGTRVLERVLADHPLEFIVLCSSLTGVTGAVGQVDYCAANAYLDAFARYQTLRGIFTVSIDWDAWREAGMAAEARLPRDLAKARQQTLAMGLTNAEGIEVFRRCLAGEAVQVLVSTGGWKPHASDEPIEAIGTPTVPAAQVSDVPLNPRPNLGAPFTEPGDDIERKICAAWQETLGIDRIGINDSFFDLGGHSLHAIQLMAKLNAEFGTSVPVARLYEGLTPAFVAGLVREARQETEPASQSPLEPRPDRLTRQRRHQERRRVAKTGTGRLA